MTILLLGCHSPLFYLRLLILWFLLVETKRRGREYLSQLVRIHKYRSYKWHRTIHMPFSLMVHGNSQVKHAFPIGWSGSVVAPISTSFSTFCTDLDVLRCFSTFG